MTIKELVQRLVEIGNLSADGPHTEVMVHTVYPENMGEHVLPIDRVSRRQFANKDRSLDYDKDVVVLTGMLYNRRT